MLAYYGVYEGGKSHLVYVAFVRNLDSGFAVRDKVRRAYGLAEDKELRDEVMRHVVRPQSIKRAQMGYDSTMRATSDRVIGTLLSAEGDYISGYQCVSAGELE